jgi:putative ABC transport system permease protein
MSWRRLRGLWRRWTAPAAVERELDEEVRAYVGLLADEKAAGGLAPEQARRVALLEAGGVEQIKDRVRDARLGAWMEEAWQDARYGARLLARAPGFTAVAVGALALGIGAAAVIFAAVDAVLLRPLPYAGTDHLVVVLHGGRHPVSAASYRELAALRSFDAIGAAEYWRANLAASGPAETVVGVRVTPGTLEMLGVAPALGRLPGSQDEPPGRDGVVVLGHGLWQRRFGADRGVLGRTVRFDGRPYTVVGVMPPGFEFPPFWARGAQMWAPLALADRTAADGRSLRVFARLAPGATLGRAQAEIAAAVARGESAQPGSMRGLAARPLLDVVVSDVRPALLMLLGAVGLLLLIACANVAHLLLARATARRKEIAIRMAVGARPLRLVRQLLTESLVLALLGAAGGIVLAQAGTALLAARLPASIPRVEAIAVDGRVLAAAVGMALLSGILFGLAPAAQTGAGGVQDALRGSERGSSDGPRRARLRNVLVASEVALALVLLVGAGLLIRTLAALRGFDPGFRAAGVLSMAVSVGGSEQSPADRRTAFYGAVLERLRALPGVESASAINHLPLAGDIWGRTFHVEGSPLPAAGEAPSASYRVVLPGYFDTMQIPLLRGRDFTIADDLASPGVVVVNETLARRFWPGEDPLGRRLALGDPRSGSLDWLQVVGVARNAAGHRWAAAPEAEVYLPVLQVRSYLERPEPHYSYLTFVLRTAADPAALGPSARAVVTELAPDSAVSQVKTMEEVVAGEMAQQRLYAALVAAFAALALLLAALGIYGIVSFTVSRRQREIAIRMALGARPADVLRLVLGQGLRAVALGTAAGLAGALAVTRLLRSLLYGVSASDPLTMAAVVMTLALVGAATACVPARRAIRIQALAALRDE